MHMGITGYLLVSSTGSGSRRLLTGAALAFLPEVPEAAGAAAGAGEGGMTRRRNAGPGLWLLKYRSEIPEKYRDVHKEECHRMV